MPFFLFLALSIILFAISIFIFYAVKNGRFHLYANKVSGEIYEFYMGFTVLIGKVEVWNIKKELKKLLKQQPIKD